MDFGMFLDFSTRQGKGHESAFQEAFDLVETEFVAGFIYVGDYGENPTDRPRPKAEDKITWF